MDQPITTLDGRPIESVGDALLREMSRVRDEIMPRYIEIGSAGAIALAMMRRDLDLAARALAEGEAIDCLQALQSLQGYTD